MTGAALLRRAKVIGVVLVALALLWALAPRERMGAPRPFDAAAIGAEPDLWLGMSEQQFADIRPGAAKRILWAGEKGRKTPLSVVYVHGFTASAEEIRPVPDEVAKALGANLFFTRLAGQGRSPEAMAEARAEDWMSDMAEAMAIGRALGDQVLVIGTSLGGVLAAMTAADPQLSEGLAGVVLISPAFGVRSPARVLIDAPFARYWVPLVAGGTHRVAVQNEWHARYWATEIPTASLFPLATLLREAREVEWERVQVPALFLFSPQDQVVSIGALQSVASRWGSAMGVSAELAPREMTAGDDPLAHVIAGDVLSPGQTEAVIALILGWMARHPRG